MFIFYNWKEHFLEYHYFSGESNLTVQHRLGSLKITYTAYSTYLYSNGIFYIITYRIKY